MNFKTLHSLIVWRELNTKAQAFMFNSGTVFIETVSGMLLVALAAAAAVKSDLPFNFGIQYSSQTVPLIVGIMQLVIAPILCKGKCWASRGLLAAVSGVIWAVVAASVYEANPPEPVNFVGAVIMTVSMAMAVINLIASRNTVDKARELNFKE